MNFTCEQCDSSFDSNFALYNHKISNHGPVVGIVSKGHQLADTLKVNKVGDDPDRFKRYRAELMDPNPSKYRKVYESDNDRGEKRNLSDGSSAEEAPSKRRKVSPQGVKRRIRTFNQPPSKRRKVRNQGMKRGRFSSSEELSPVQFKRRKVEYRGHKRQYYSSDDLQPPPKHRRTHRQGVKRFRDDDFDDDSDEGGFPAKYPRISRENPAITELKRLLKEARRENTDMSKKNKECEEQIRELKMQIDEVQNTDGDFELNDTINSVINDVSISEFNRIRELMDKGNLTAVLRSNKHVSALRKLFLALSWGIVPITAPQRIRLSENEKNLIKRLKDASVDEVRRFIRVNKSVFINLFKVIKNSIELVVNSYNSK